MLCTRKPHIKPKTSLRRDIRARAARHHSRSAETSKRKLYFFFYLKTDLPWMFFFFALSLSFFNASPFGSVCQWHNDGHGHVRIAAHLSFMTIVTVRTESSAIFFFCLLLFHSHAEIVLFVFLSSLLELGFRQRTHTHTSYNAISSACTGTHNTNEIKTNSRW